MVFSPDKIDNPKIDFNPKVVDYPKIVDYLKMSVTRSLKLKFRAPQLGWSRCLGFDACNGLCVTKPGELRTDDSQGNSNLDDFVKTYF